LAKELKAARHKAKFHRWQTNKKARKAAERAAAKTDAAGISLRKGARATAVGLRARTDLNGSEVRVLRNGGRHDAYRWTVKVVGTGEEVNVRSQNLAVLAPAAPAPAGPMTAAEALRLAAAEGLALQRRASNTTGFVGIYKNFGSKTNPYESSIPRRCPVTNRYPQHLGTFATAEEAALVRARALANAPG